MEMSPLRHMHQVFARPHHICNSISKQEIIDNVLGGMNPVQHFCLVFQNRPSTWAHVDGLCIHDQNIFFTGSVRLSEAPRTLVAAYSHQPQIQDIDKLKSSPLPANQLCFYCKKQGCFQHDSFKYLRLGD